MTAIPAPDERAVWRSPILLWVAFALVHVVFGLIIPTSPTFPASDVQLVYKPWAQLAMQGHVVGIESEWVYPIGALLPILIPLVVGVDNYYLGWFLLVTALDAIALGVLLGGGNRRRIAAAWWWIAFVAMLGPVGIGRLDSVSMSLVIIGLLWLAARERLAIVVLAVAFWIKVWPAAVIGALIIATGHRWRVIVGTLVVSAVIAIVVVTFGGAPYLFGFVTEQTGRGVQIEAPIALPWLWMAAAHVPQTYVYFNNALTTYQVTGAGIDTASMIMTPVLALAGLAVVLVSIRAVRRGSPAVRVLPPLVLAIVSALIAFNKVGSPQYFDWLAPAVVLGIVYQGRRFVVPGVLVGVATVMTQLIYPWMYSDVVGVQPPGLTLLTVRNLLEFVVFAWAMVALWRAAAPQDARNADPDPHSVPVWPFDRRYGRSRRGAEGGSHGARPPAGFGAARATTASIGPEADVPAFEPLEE